MDSQKKKVALTTFGCRANQYDTGVLANILEKASYEVVDFDEKADVYVINSCAITAQASVEARQYIGRARRINPDAITIVTGCAAQADSDQLKGTEGLHYIVGNNSKGRILEIIQTHGQSNATSLPAPQQDARFKELFFGGGVTLPKHTRSFLKIQDGCSQFCSFCIVPFARGLNRSVDPDRVMESLYELKAKGVEEVVITGIHLGTYGKDLTPRSSLMELLLRMEREKPVPRLRLSSIDPEELTDEMIELVAESDMFCPHFHLPLQSGDDTILSKMRRRYTGRHFLELTEKIVKRIPDVCVGTDVIIGFPGEGEEEYRNTFKILEASPLAYVHVFPYSPREGTKAALFDNHVDGAVKKKRCKEVRGLSERKRDHFHRQFEGRVLNAVLEQRRGSLKALTSNYISVAIAEGDRYSLPTRLVPVQVSSISDQEVHGHIVASH